MSPTVRGRALGTGCRETRDRGFKLSYTSSPVRRTHSPSGARELIARPRFGHGARFLPRKEVIQPHLPVRLPCYDFTPLTLHTFGASAPCGFGRRLRVQTTRVV